MAAAQGHQTLQQPVGPDASFFGRRFGPGQGAGTDVLRSGQQGGLVGRLLGGLVGRPVLSLGGKGAGGDAGMDGES